MQSKSFLSLSVYLKNVPEEQVGMNFMLPVLFWMNGNVNKLVISVHVVPLPMAAIVKTSLVLHIVYTATVW